MPPKTRGTTRTRAALQAKQLDPDKDEGGTAAVTGKHKKTRTVDSFKDSDTTSSVKRARIRSKPAEVVGGVSEEEKPTPSEKKGKGGSKATRQAKTKKGKMATSATSRKRRQKAAVTTSPADVKGVGDGEGAQVKVETPPPSKKRKDDKPVRPVEPVEETDRVVCVAPPVVVEEHKQKKVIKSKEVPMETGNVPPISHHSHSNVCGQVFVMGQGDIGQLGLGEDMIERKKPHPVGGALEDCRVSQVVCGGMHSVALTDDGKVFTWGCNDEGVLGRTIAEGEEFTPGVVDQLEGVKIVQVAAGDSHTAALTDNGSIYCWGIFRDSSGAFGLVQTTPSFSPESLYSQPSNRAVKVASGSHHVAFVTEHGDIYTFGCAEQGQLGRVSECFSSRGGRKGLSLLLQPAVVRFRAKRGAGKPKFCDVFCGPYHTFGVTNKGAVYVWGLNNYGQLCTGDTEMRFQPEKLEDNWIGGRGQGGVGMAKGFGIASGAHHTVVCCDGDVLTCGRKEYGRLGLGKENPEPKLPTQIDSLKGVKVVSVEAAGCCSFLVTATGDLYSWGMGTTLQLGMSEEDDIWTPEKVTGKKIENRRTLSVSAGGQHTALLVSSNTDTQ